MLRASALFVALTVSACAHPASTSTSGGAPAAGVSPCSIAGTCSVTVVIADDVANQLSRAGMNFKAYMGCPRSLGFRDISAEPTKVPFVIGSGSAEAMRGNSSMRGAIPVAESANRTLVIPRLAGRYATIAIFFGADPAKFAVVDFGAGPDQTVKFGYAFNGPSLVDDPVVDAQNRLAARHLCP